MEDTKWLSIGVNSLLLLLFCPRMKRNRSESDVSITNDDHRHINRRRNPPPVSSLLCLSPEMKMKTRLLVDENEKRRREGLENKNVSEF